ncbi:hypothetical protein [Streptomyces sp900116325]|uniref:Uncharacterized protein n=1 Tax=Streptomyces sp. 900116325 TaxID=3154295 RepID=A0ABV2UCJ0_9ACTN
MTDGDAGWPSALDPAACSDPAGPTLRGSRAFTLVSLACGLAVDTGQLTGFRLAQGVAAEVMIPKRSWFRVGSPRWLSLQWLSCS